MATHSSTLAWKIPWTEEPCRLQSMGSLGVRHDLATSLSLFTFLHWIRKWHRLCAALWTAAHQASLSTGFSRQEYWNELPFPSPLPMASNALSVALASSETARAPERTPGCCKEHVPEPPQTGWLPSGEGPGPRGRPHCRLWQHGLATRGRAPKE